MDFLREFGDIGADFTAKMVNVKEIDCVLFHKMCYNFFGGLTLQITS
jgi:hypothetical protein